MKKIVVFNGVHGSGKTTVAELTATRVGAAYFFEIGGQLRSEVTYNCLQSSESFDQEVIKREIARDQELLSSERMPVVETWHLGNLAYILLRSPRLVEEYLQKIRIQLSLLDPLVVHLSISSDTFFRRVTEKVPSNQLTQLYDFYRNIQRNLLWAYRLFNLNWVQISNDGALEDTVRRVVVELNTSLKGGQ